MPSSGDIVLAIETSNPSVAASVAVGRATEHEGVTTLGVEPVSTGQHREDDLLPAIDRLCRRAGVAPRSITHVAVSIGPGGYTALRTAVAAAKVIAEATGDGTRHGRCIGVPTALAATWRFARHDSDPAIGVALASKNGVGKDPKPTAWVAVLHGTADERAAAAMNGTILDEAGFASLRVGTLLADKFLADPLRRAAERADVRIVETVYDAGACLEVACSGVLPEVDPEDLLPLYPREPDAVTLWRSRGRESGPSGPNTTGP